jgi:hypothetical protein
MRTFSTILVQTSWNKVCKLAKRFIDSLVVEASEIRDAGTILENLTSRDPEFEEPAAVDAASLR